jgi:argininosuccinate lyase
VRTVKFREERCRGAAGRGFSNATDLADLLVAAGVPFRDAHERAGKAVRAAIELGVELEELPAQEQQRLLPELATVDLARELSVDAVLDRRSAIGGTAPKRVLEEVRDWKRKLKP